MSKIKAGICEAIIVFKIAIISNVGTKIIVKNFDINCSTINSIYNPVLRWLSFASFMQCVEIASEFRNEELITAGDNLTTLKLKE